MGEGVSIVQGVPRIQAQSSRTATVARFATHLPFLYTTKVTSIV